MKTILGNITLSEVPAPWRLEASSTLLEEGLEHIRLRFTAPEPSTPPKMTLDFSYDKLDAQQRWKALAGNNMELPPDWGAAFESHLAKSIPLVSFFDINDTNCCTVTLSDAIRPMRFDIAGIREEDANVRFQISFFYNADADISSYELTLRLDTRRISYQAAIGSSIKWLETFDEYKPAPPPPAAFDSVYSFWYSYHQNLFQNEIEEELALAAKMGMKTVIVDDGWQVDNNFRGYAYCGDWEISKNRFPDMAAHVKRVHELGMKYMIWFSVPFIGIHSKAWTRFDGKTLNLAPEIRSLDPRYPDVREYLIGIYERAIREWDLDGLKLDFIDAFNFDKDLAAEKNFEGCDIRSLPLAVDRLLTDVMTRLRAIKPDILIEFRQNYIGPAIRKYGNMLRACDCPGDPVRNRILTLALRHTSGASAVHSDMVEWNTKDSVEIAALQLVNIIFSVPQISVKLALLPDDHKRMLQFWLDFMEEHKETLLRSTLTAKHPHLNYHVVIAERDCERIPAVYNDGECALVKCENGKREYLVNATLASSLVVEVAAGCTAEIRNTCGDIVDTITLTCGFHRINVPSCGVISFTLY